MRRPTDNQISDSPILAPIYFPREEEDARKAYLFNGPIEAFRKFYDRAESGSADAQAVIACMYLNRWVDDEKSIEIASHWARLSSDSGSPYGQWILAWALLERGLVVEGMRAMLVSSDQGFAPAYFNLGSFLMNGVGFKKNEAMGMAAFSKAASLGHHGAIDVMEYARKNGYYGFWSMVVARITTPIVGPIRYTIRLLFGRKFGSDRLIYLRNIIVENAIRESLGDENIDSLLRREEVEPHF